MNSLIATCAFLAAVGTAFDSASKYTFCPIPSNFVHRIEGMVLTAEPRYRTMRYEDVAYLLEMFWERYSLDHNYDIGMFGDNAGFSPMPLSGPLYNTPPCGEASIYGAHLCENLLAGIITNGFGASLISGRAINHTTIVDTTDLFGEVAIPYAGVTNLPPRLEYLSGTNVFDSGIYAADVVAAFNFLAKYDNVMRYVEMNPLVNGEGSSTAERQRSEVWYDFDPVSTSWSSHSTNISDSSSSAISNMHLSASYSFDCSSGRHTSIAHWYDSQGGYQTSVSPVSHSKYWSYECQDGGIAKQIGMFDYDIFTTNTLTERISQTVGFDMLFSVRYSEYVTDSSRPDGTNYVADIFTHVVVPAYATRSGRFVSEGATNLGWIVSMTYDQAINEAVSKVIGKTFNLRDPLSAFGGGDASDPVDDGGSSGRSITISAYYDGSTGVDYDISPTSTYEGGGSQ